METEAARCEEREGCGGRGRGVEGEGGVWREREGCGGRGRGVEEKYSFSLHFTNKQKRDQKIFYTL